MPALHSVVAGELSVAYWDEGAPAAPVAVLLHGFPYDVLAYEDVAPVLVAAGLRVVVPYLRGYGPTTFTEPDRTRSGEQASLAADLLALLDALGIERAVVAGYDWGGRAACTVAALWPERVRGLVTCGGYNIQHRASSMRPASPEAEYRFWYQYYLHGERGRRGLAEHRAEFCRLLWRLWSPKWSFTDEQYAATTPSFDNPDFVEVVVHSYRHRYELVPGDDRYAEIEAQLATTPTITVPTVGIDGDADGVASSDTALRSAKRFTGRYERRLFAGIGHNVPQEAPADFARAVLDVAAG